MATSLLEPRPPSLARQHYRGAVAARRKAMRVVRLLSFVALLAVAVGGWYVGKRGFGRQARLRIADELRKHGVHASISRLTLDPFRGLVAQDVRIFDAKNENTLAVISQIALDLNYSALLHHQPFLNSLEVRDARLTIPLPPNESLPTKARITNVRAHVYFPPDQIHLREIEGSISGVRFAVSGQLIKRADYQPPPDTSEAEWRRRMEWLQRIIAEMEACRFPAAAPVVQVKFTADLAHMEAARATLTFQADRVQRGAYELRDARVVAEWADEVLNVTRCEWHDAAGVFAAHATWRRRTNTAEFDAHSTVALKSVAEACGFGHLAADLTFTAPPLIELSGSANFAEAEPRVSLIGEVNATGLTYSQVPITSLTGSFAWDGKRTLVRELRARLAGGGEIAADLLDAPDEFRLSADSTANPALFRAVVPADFAKVLGEFEWQRPPKIHVSVTGKSRSPEDWTGDGTVALERTRFRTAWLNSATANLRFADHAVTFTDIRVVRDEGIGTGAIAYDFSKHEVRLTNVKTTLRPTDVIAWIEPRLYRHVAPYKFRHVPSATTNGVIQFKGGIGDHLEVIVDAPTGMEYVFIHKTLPIDRVSGRLLFTNNRLQISDLAGTLFGGSLRGAADISLARGDSHYHANLVADGLDFPKLTELYFNYKSARGRLSGSFDWTGVSDEARTIDGAGKLRVSEGNVFAIPIFGPLSSMLGAIIPGAGYSIAHQATADFTMKNGVLHTNNFNVSGKLYSLVGHGDIDALNEKLDFDVKISSSGAGALLTPVYNLFEYKGEGSFSNPRWHPKNF